MPPGGIEERGSFLTKRLLRDHWLVNEVTDGRLPHLSTRKTAEWSQRTGLGLAPGLSYPAQGLAGKTLYWDKKRAPFGRL